MTYFFYTLLHIFIIENRQIVVTFRVGEDIYHHELFSTLQTPYFRSLYMCLAITGRKEMRFVTVTFYNINRLAEYSV